MEIFLINYLFVIAENRYNILFLLIYFFNKTVNPALFRLMNLSE